MTERLDFNAVAMQWDEEPRRVKLAGFSSVVVTPVTKVIKGDHNFPILLATARLH